MQKQDYENLYDLETSFWWFVGMREITAALLKPFVRTSDRLILDAGCGTGGNLEWLRRYAGSGEVIGIDLTSEAISFCRQRGEKNLTQASVTSLPFVDSTFDVVTSFDVLVQLPGDGADEQSISEMYRVLRHGGIAFVRVAAYEWMRSGHDEALGSQRRYNLRPLTQNLEQAGFRILRATYANSLLLPVAVFRRLIMKRLGLADKGSDVKPLGSRWQWLDTAMKAALRTEALWIDRTGLRIPVGLSAICVAEKPRA